MPDENFGYGCILPNTGFDAAVERVTEELGKEGFSVITDIDMQATLAKKLGAEFRPYRILGACNPNLAKRALEAEPQAGLLLPCNVVVQAAEGGSVAVSVIDPKAMLQMVDNPAVAEVAVEADRGLRRVVAALG